MIDGETMKKNGESKSRRTTYNPNLEGQHNNCNKRNSNMLGNGEKRKENYLEVDNNKDGGWHELGSMPKKKKKTWTWKGNMRKKWKQTLA